MTTLIPKYDVKNGGATPAGAINRPINEKLAEVLSVKDFGAVGDGVTDDTAAIQAAIDATALYGILTFPEGIYVVSDTLNLPQSIGLVGGNIGSRGVQQAVLKWSVAGGTMFTVTPGAPGLGTSFKGIRFVNNNVADMTIIDATGAFNLLVEECLFSGLGTFTHAIVLKETSATANDGSFSTLIRQNQFANSSVYVESASNGTQIIQNQFWAEIVDYAGAMLYASNNVSSSGLNALVINNNQFEGTIVSGAFFVDLTLIQGCVFENNRVEAYTGGTVKFTQMLQSCTVTGNYLNIPYVYSGDRATSAHNAGQAFTEFSNFIADQTDNTFTEVNNIQGVFSGKNLFQQGVFASDWYFGNCSYSYVQDGSLGLRSPVLNVNTPTGGTASAVMTSSLVGQPELALAIANELFTTTVFIVKALSTNTATSVVTVDTGDTAEYWTIPKDDKWHVIKVVRRMETTDTQLRPSVYLAYASSYNAGDKVYIGGIGVFVGNAGFTLPYFTQWSTDPASASNTKAWVAGEKVDHIGTSSGNPTGYICTVSGSPGTWKSFGAII